MGFMEDDGRAYWDRNARNYERSLRFLGRPIPRMLELTVASVRGARRVLEVGAGTGVITMAIAPVVEELVATDYAATMVTMVHRRARLGAFQHIRCEQADVHALPYDDGWFGAVVAGNILHLVPDLPRALAELRRVLAPGGKLVAPTFCHDETVLSWLLSRALALSGFPGRRRFTSRSLAAALERAGFRITSSESVPGIIPIGFVEAVPAP
jgi:phosphatidylethanolamine/phosphatidyl-N-methylethanolamine N-methyltransferase